MSQTKLRVLVGIALAITAMFMDHNAMVMGCTISGSILCLAIIDYWAGLEK